MASFDDPARWTFTRFTVEFALFFTATSDVSSVSVDLLDELSYSRRIITFIQAQVFFAVDRTSRSVNATSIVS